MDRLFGLSLSMKVMASQCKLNIAKATNRYYNHEINYDQTNDLCKQELEKIKIQSDDWQNTYFSNTENCFLVKYRYGNSDGLKTTVEDYYSLDPNQYKEGNYPYLDKEFDAYYGLNRYKEVSEKYEEFLLDIVYN